MNIKNWSVSWNSSNVEFRFCEFGAVFVGLKQFVDVDLFHTTNIFVGGHRFKPLNDYM